MSHYTHLSIEERESLLLSIGAGKTLREIARILQRSASTLSRELKRNCENREEYSPDKATRNYRKRRKKCCRQRILKDVAAKALIQRLFLEQQWSPEQIDNRLKLEKNKIQVSYSTIYRSIYSGDLETEKLSHGQRGVARKLRHSGKPGARKEMKNDVEKSSLVIQSKNARMKRGTERNWGIGKQIQLPAKQARPA